MALGISEVNVGYTDRTRREVRSVTVRFGAGFELTIDTGDSGTRLRLGCEGRSVVLDASGATCGCARAVNLLRLHMPETAKA